MSKSLASFHLTGKKLMDTSVDHLFKNGEDVFTAGAVSQMSSHQLLDADTPIGPGPSVTVETAAITDKQKTKLVSEYHRQKSQAPATTQDTSEETSNS